MSVKSESWRLMTPEGLFETDLETLKQWIAEGCVDPSDKVSKGNLHWIEAGRAPVLRAAFQAVPPPSQAAAMNSPVTTWQPENPHAESFDDPDGRPVSPAHASQAVAPAAGARCFNHPEAHPRYICRICQSTFCERCPKLVNKVALCPLCGDLCKPYEEEARKVVRREFQGSGFGMEDFAQALQYPFKHLVALFCGAAIYGFLLLAGFRGRMVAGVILFGCMSHVITQVAWGRLHRSFMPDFSEFSMYDDFAVPVGLGIGITVVTYGPLIVLVLAIFFGVLKGTPALLPAAGGAEPQQSAITREDLSALTAPDADPAKIEEANKKLGQLRPGYQISEEAKKSQEEGNDPAANIKWLVTYGYGSMIVALMGLLALAWAIFYYPMALAVAGYTQSFGSVINPLVGLDTIRRMGSSYWKAFAMVAAVGIAGFIVSVVVAFATSPFTLPFIGNLPAKFIDGTVAFYFNLVIACVMGLSLFKCADRLGIETD